MGRFYVPPDCVRDSRIHIRGREAHHILDVMRLGVSDRIVAFDGTGREYLGVIRTAGKDSLVVDITETRKTAVSGLARISLIQSIPKKEKMDYIVEKATELGVSSISPVMTERTIVDWDDDKRRKAVERWRKIALEASKQCGRSDIPRVEDIVKYSRFIAQSGVYDRVFMAALDDSSIDLRKAIGDFAGRTLALAIGPEGDFAPEEISLARKEGFTIISLGQRVLKSDTAGLAALAILQYELSA